MLIKSIGLNEAHATAFNLFHIYGQQWN